MEITLASWYFYSPVIEWTPPYIFHYNQSFFASLLLSINQKPFSQVLNKDCPTPFLLSLDSIISHILHFFQNLTPVIIHCLPVTSISIYWHSILPRKALLIWFLSCSKKFTDIKIFDVSLLQSGSIYFHSVEISFWKKKNVKITAWYRGRSSIDCYLLI